MNVNVFFRAFQPLKWYSVQQNPSWEAKNIYASEENRRILWDRMIRASSWSLSSANIIQSAFYLFENNLNTAFSSMTSFPRCLFPSHFQIESLCGLLFKCPSISPVMVSSTYLHLTCSKNFEAVLYSFLKPPVYSTFIQHVPQNITNTENNKYWSKTALYLVEIS
jgi:hypothetical protein